MIAFLCLNSGPIKYKNMKEISHGSGLSEGKKNKNTTHNLKMSVLLAENKI